MERFELEEVQKKMKKKDHCNFHLLLLIHRLIPPSVPPLQLADECINFFHLISGKKKKKRKGKSSAATQSISAAFCPELMKSHAYWNHSCVLPWRWRDHLERKIRLCFKSVTQSWVWKKNSLFLSLPYSVIECDTETLIYLFNTDLLLPGYIR